MVTGLERGSEALVQHLFNEGGLIAWLTGAPECVEPQAPASAEGRAGKGPHSSPLPWHQAWRVFHKALPTRPHALQACGLATRRHAACMHPDSGLTPSRKPGYSAACSMHAAQVEGDLCAHAWVAWGWGVSPRVLFGLRRREGAAARGLYGPRDRAGQEAGRAGAAARGRRARAGRLAGLGGLAAAGAAAAQRDREPVQARRLSPSTQKALLQRTPRQRACGFLCACIPGSKPYSRCWCAGAAPVRL